MTEKEIKAIVLIITIIMFVISDVHERCCVILGTVYNVLHRVSRSDFLGVSHVHRRERDQPEGLQFLRRRALVGRGK